MSSLSSHRSNPSRPRNVGIWDFMDSKTEPFTSIIDIFPSTDSVLRKTCFINSMQNICHNRQPSWETDSSERMVTRHVFLPVMSHGIVTICRFVRRRKEQTMHRTNRLCRRHLHHFIYWVHVITVRLHYNSPGYYQQVPFFVRAKKGTKERGKAPCQAPP